MGLLLSLSWRCLKDEPPKNYVDQYSLLKDNISLNKLLTNVNETFVELYKNEETMVENVNEENNESSNLEKFCETVANIVNGFHQYMSLVYYKECRSL